MYNKQNTTDDYNKDLSKEQQTLAGIQAEISSASRDTSFSGQARLKQLQEELKAQQDKIDEMVLNHSRDVNNQIFEDEKTRLEEQNKVDLANLDKKYSDEEIQKMAKEAIISEYLRDVNGNVVSLKSVYIDFENRFGEGLTVMGQSIKDNLIATLTEAKDLMQTMGYDGNFNVNTNPQIDGSHSGGLLSVPWDGYIAELHKDERVLTAEESKNYLSGKNIKLINNFTTLVQPKIEIPKISFPQMRNSVSPSVVFNEPFMIIEGNVGKESLPELNEIVKRAKDEVTKAIIGQITDLGSFSH